jgi:hypothetical protein
MLVSHFQRDQQLWISLWSDGWRDFTYWEFVMLDLELFTSYTFWTPNYRNAEMVFFPGISRTEISKLSIPNHCLLEIPNLEMLKCQNAPPKVFHVSRIQSFLCGALYSLSTRMLKCRFSKFLQISYCDLWFRAFLPPVAQSLILGTSKTPNSEVPKFWPRHSLPLYTKLFSRLGDLINQRFCPHFGLMIHKMLKWSWRSNDRNQRSTLNPAFRRWICPMLNFPQNFLGSCGPRYFGSSPWRILTVQFPPQEPLAQNWLCDPSLGCDFCTTTWASCFILNDSKALTLLSFLRKLRSSRRLLHALCWNITRDVLIHVFVFCHGEDIKS